MKITISQYSLKIIPETPYDIALLDHAVGLKEIKNAVLVKRVEEYENAMLKVYAEIEFGQPILEVKYKEDKEPAIGFIQEEQPEEEDGEGCHVRKR